LENGYNFDRGFDGFEWIRGQEGDRWKTSPKSTSFKCNENKDLMKEFHEILLNYFDETGMDK